MGFLKDKTRLRRPFFILGLTAAIGAGALPSIDGNMLRNLYKGELSDSETFGYALEIIRENRTGLSSTEEVRLAKVILGEASANNLDPIFVLAVIKTESTFNNWSRSVKGALGLMQIMPSTGRSLARELHLKWDGEATLLDPYLNVKMGIHYLVSLRGHYNDDTKMTLSAYNIGPTYLDDEAPQGFANKVLANYWELKERAGYLN